ncbi:cation diffusion facilitator family transporter [Gordonia bronchialis DSM 43247]|uniref:Cation diffusion facilitator family transporter n=1 Tax=Gordonia bronchialis (strain ATCC 25592 / DSM 43247 / BCRC 13721 / JCM 3198 / KCTC 3076 / NBRC 16047 / NCTC 10667) TaxID=526226 RepID=D0L781_GORB4|nr:cation diffusion facilitator family transporter [Gordonia bronchialis]ACY20866.1 cation diffusion facilitator family transporter [Gordonia bronchialis DSM 43247]MCC3323641.1 cation diffusion facilitator family transporter [Gordonia bronchialis]QGS25400.1 cation diffusion facilitator family transporter [Gordonia bronchialis]STQ63705.1 zinc transporter ZitB [Gordonia bronchialis]
MVTVVIAFAMNILVAVAKSVAAALTGSAAMVAEAAHSWADAGNEVFLLIAERRGARGRDRRHPFGHGRETYVWSMFAAFGLFTVGAVVSIMHGISALSDPEPDADYLIGYLVLAISALLEGVSFAQSVRQARAGGRRMSMSPLRFVVRTSNTTLRAVFAEDAAALTGLAIAALGMALHEITGEAFWDALGSILVGCLLAYIAVFLIKRNSEFLVGQVAMPSIRDDMLRRLREHPDIDRVTYLHAEYVGPVQFYLVAAVDIVGDLPEHQLASRLRSLEAQLEEDDVIVEAVLTLSTVDEPSLD